MITTARVPILTAWQDDKQIDQATAIIAVLAPDGAKIAISGFISAIDPVATGDNSVELYDTANGNRRLVARSAAAVCADGKPGTAHVLAVLRGDGQVHSYELTPKRSDKWQFQEGELSVSVDDGC